METDWKKKYEEALNKARETHGTVAAGRDFLAEIFPELCESEDERIRRHLIDIVETYWGKTNDPGKAEDLAWLEKQKDTPMPEDSVIFQKGVAEGRRLERAEQKPGWSEEDEKMVETICKEGDLKPSEQRWLKSLKNRGNSPKGSANSPWKPSAEQMAALLGELPVVKGSGDKAQNILESLYDDLTKLI